MKNKKGHYGTLGKIKNFNEIEGKENLIDTLEKIILITNMNKTDSKEYDDAIMLFFEFIKKNEEEEHIQFTWRTQTQLETPKIENKLRSSKSIDKIKMNRDYREILQREIKNWILKNFILLTNE